MWSLVFLSCIFLFKSLWSSHLINTTEFSTNMPANIRASTLHSESHSRAKESESEKLIFAFAQGLVFILKQNNTSEVCVVGQTTGDGPRRCVTTISVLLLLLVKLVNITRKLIAYYGRQRNQGFPTS